MHGRSLVVALFIAAVPASASLIESGSGGVVTYQFDGDTHHDAPDTCLEASLDFALPLGNETDGMLVPGDDEADHFVLEVGQELVGARVTVQLTEPEAEVGLAVDVQVPGCEGSVMEPEHQPATPPSHPEPGPGQQQVGLSNQHEAWSCDSTRWFFVINQVGGGIAPETIHIVWTDGTEADVPMLKSTPATTAHYETQQNLGVTIHSATAILPADWDGRFNIGEGPCDAQDGGAVFGDPAQAGGDTISFTPTTAGTYIVAVVLEPVVPSVPDPMDLFRPQPASCHACFDGSEEAVDSIAYMLKGDASEDVA